MDSGDRIKDVLERLSHRLERVLPAQAPIQDFVHHNTLHGFQRLPFREAVAAAEAVNGIHGFLPLPRFREQFRAGRIDLSDINEALDETPELAPADTDAVPKRPARRRPSKPVITAAIM